MRSNVKMTSYQSEEFEKFPLPQLKITRKEYSEVLGNHNPMAIEIAASLFEIGVRQAAITERINYHPQRDYLISSRAYHIFNLVLQGELYVQIGSDRKLIKEGELAFCSAGSPYRLQTKPNGKVRFLYVEIFDTPYWSCLKDNGPYSRNYEYTDQFYLLLQRTLEAHKTRTQISLARSNVQCLVELLELERSRVDNPPKRHFSALLQLVKEIRQNPERVWNTSEMAKSLSMSRATLSRNFQTEFGYPPKVMVIQQRIAKATELLDTTSDSIDSIARQVGYESSFTFSNIFKKYTGIRPSVYRERLFTG